MRKNNALQYARNSVQSVLRTDHFKKWFDILVISDHVGLTKPDERIFKLLVKKAGVKAKEIVFIDDRVEYRKSAEKAGLDFIPFKSYKQLLKDLKKLGVR